MTAAPSSTSFVEVAAQPLEDRAAVLAQFMAEAVGAGDEVTYVEERRRLVAAKRTADFLVGCLRDAPAMFRAPVEHEIEGAFTIIFSFLEIIRQQERPGVIAASLAAALGGTDRPLLRLRIAVNLFNAIGGAADKLEVFTQAVEYAVANGASELLLPWLPQAVTWHARGLMEDARARRIYLIFSRALTAVGDSEGAQTCLIRYLTTFEAADAETMREAKEHAKDAAVGYIRAPALSQRSALPRLAAIRSLAGDARYGRLHELMTIFAEKTLSEYEAFYAAHPAVFAEWAIDHAASLETMRLLTLCSLAGGGRASLPYAAIATALKVAETDVESWVVRAIASGLVDAKIDQMARTVHVTRATQREFGPAQWAALQAKLRTWRDSVSALMASMEASAAGGGAGGRRGGRGAGAGAGAVESKA